MFFTGSVDDVTEDDLLLLKGGQSEDETWEFKSEWPRNESIQKSVCAFANSGGGYLLIGVECNEAGLVTDVPGVASFPQHNERVVSTCGAIAPRIIPQVTEVNLSNGDVVVVIFTFPSPDVPHMAGDNKYYLRAGRQSVPMPESMVNRLYAARRTEEQRVSDYLQSINAGIRPFEADNWWWLSVWAMPLRLEDNLVASSRELLDFLRKTARQLPLLALGGEAVNTHFGIAADFSTAGRTEFYLELRRSGFFSSGRTLRRPAHGLGPLEIPWRSVAQMAVEGLTAAHAIYDWIGYTYFVRFGLVLSNVGGSALANSGPGPFGRPQEIPELIVLNQDVLASDIDANMTSIVGSTMARFAQSYGFGVYDVGQDWPDCAASIEHFIASARSAVK